MEQLFRLEARLSNLRELRNLIRALRALSASQVQAAQGTLAGIGRYVDVVEDAIAGGVRLLAATHEMIDTSFADNGDVLIVICSEHGFVGGLNRRLVDHAISERRPGQRVVIVGHRGATLGAEKGLESDRVFAMATHVAGVLGVARGVADELTYVSRASVIYAAFEGSAEPQIVTKSILPLDPSLLVESGHEMAPLHHLKPALLLQELAAEYLFAEITRAVTEGLASENIVRLHVMEAADQNIGDKLEVMQRQANTARQEMITSELLEVVTGAEAIREMG